MTRSMLESAKINRCDVGVNNENGIVSAVRFFSSVGESTGVCGKWPPNETQITAMPASNGITPDVNIRQVNIFWNTEALVGVQFSDAKEQAVCGGKGTADICACGLGVSQLEIPANQYIVGVKIQLANNKTVCGISFSLAEF